MNVVAPWVMADASTFGGQLRLSGMANLEGLTIPDGVPSMGAWGEGFVDRRHPHTYLHELMLTGKQHFSGETVNGASFAMGKGFAPFGSDDPMVRPFLSYPVNHHLAQILERLVAVVAVRAGPLIAEAGVFNGDEPTGPEDWPELSRFGDSWSGRLTLLPWPSLELQGSYANVNSPEHESGAGLDQAKWSTSARLERTTGLGRAYALVEWARTEEGDDVFAYRSVLAEAALHGRVAGLAYRFERTERPEEQRAGEPFRTVRPQLDNSVLGKSRWSIHTIALDAVLADDWPGLRVAPFVEVSAGRVTSLTPASFDPVAIYGRDTFWSITAGVRVGLGMRLHRMGRYGVALPEMPAHDAGMNHEMMH
ncbi:MAG TPA: hypothetical protein VFI41_11075 [Gemmatimonadales bacterium]|nr:hypothetical protein [Gemmatimonadales bacterium]